jgi:hypothetical protein
MKEAAGIHPSRAAQRAAGLRRNPRSAMSRAISPVTPVADALLRRAAANVVDPRLPPREVAAAARDMKMTIVVLLPVGLKAEIAGKMKIVMSKAASLPVAEVRGAKAAVADILHQVRAARAVRAIGKTKIATSRGASRPAAAAVRDRKTTIVAIHRPAGPAARATGRTKIAMSKADSAPAAAGNPSMTRIAAAGADARAKTMMTAAIPRAVRAARATGRMKIAMSRAASLPAAAEARARKMRGADIHHPVAAPRATGRMKIAMSKVASPPVVAASRKMTTAPIAGEARAILMKSVEIPPVAPVVRPNTAVASLHANC